MLIFVISGRGEDDGYSTQNKQDLVVIGRLSVDITNTMRHPPTHRKESSKAKLVLQRALINQYRFTIYLD